MPKFSLNVQYRNHKSQMTNATEYRDSYCWFYGGPKRSPDKVDDLVRSKLNGTYVPDPPKRVPKFGFEKNTKDANNAVIPNPQNVSPANKTKRSRKSIVYYKANAERIRREKRNAKLAHTRRSHFVNYGQGNTNPTNEELFMTTFNVKAPTGVNPHTKMKHKLRPWVLAEFTEPLPTTTVHMHEPKFYASMKDMPREEQLEMDGPFWVHWPSSEPFPEPYSALERIVRP